MKKILVLSGYSCKSWIWKDIKDDMKSGLLIDIIEWLNDKVVNFHSL